MGSKAELWHAILTRLNMTSKMLKSSTLDINNAVALLSSLKEFIESIRAQFDFFEGRVKALETIKTFQSKRKRTNIRDDVLTGDSEFTARDRLKVESFHVYYASTHMPKCVAYLAFCRDCMRSAMTNYGDHLKR